MKSKDPKAPPTPQAIPDGWYPINPQQVNAQSKTKKPNSNNVRNDELGLTRAIHPANMKVPQLLKNNAEEDAVRKAHSSPRHRKLQQQLQIKSCMTNEPNSAACAVAHAFAPNKSLRSARLQPVGDSRQSAVVELPLLSQEIQPKTVKRTVVTSLSSSFSRAARIKEHAPVIVPLHKAVRSFDDAVEASPLAESNQVAITELFLSDWMARFDQDRSLYKSIVVHAEVAFRELYRMTANLALPNDVVTAFACKIFDDITEHFGPFSTIMHVLSSELRLAIYAPPTAQSTARLPYFAIVKHQKRILLSLRKDQLRRQDRNDFLRYEIDKVHDTFLQFLDHCALGLVRTIFREWYSVAIVSKRNSRKYVEYFSAWFGGSAKSLVPRVFLAWKHLAVETKVACLHEQLTKHQEKLAGLQKQIEELTVQRDLTQLESLAVRNDRKHAEDSIQRLHRKIQSASVYLEGSQRREALVAQEGQLRVEAVTFLPPLVLESLLRGFHNAGFLQPLHSEFVPVEPTAAELSPVARGQAAVIPTATATAATAAKPSIVKQCIATILNHSLPTSSASLATTKESESNSDTRSKSADPLLSLDDFGLLLRSVKLRLEDDSTAHLLFVSDADREKNENEEDWTVDDNHNSDDGDGDSGDGGDGGAVRSPTARPTQRLAALIGQFRHALRNVRHQGEHYARHGKLFSSRMLEPNEISVVPHPRKLLASASRPALAAASTIDALAATQVADRTFGERIPFSTTSIALSGEEDVSSPLVRVEEDNGSTNNPSIDSPVKYASIEQLELLRPQDLDLSPRHTGTFLLLALGQLVSEYGSLLFSPTDMTVFVRNRVLQKIMLRGIAGGKHATLPTIAAAVPSDDDHYNADDASCSSSSSGEEREEEEDDDSSDTGDQVDAEPVKSPLVHGGKRATGQTTNKTASRPSGTSTKQEEQHHSHRLQHVAPRRMSSYRGLHAPIAKEIDRGLSHLVTAYDTWNRLAQQLVEVEIVHARGIVAVALPDASVTAAMDASLSPSTAAFTGAATITASPNLVGLASGARANGDKSATSLATLRPRLQLHIEPLASGALLTAAKEKDRSEAPTTPNGSHRRSMSTLSTSDWSFHTSKIRSLSPSDTQQLTHAMQSLHEMIATGATQQRARDYTNAKRTLTTLRLLQWRHASELASQFTVVEPASVANTTATSSAAATASSSSSSSPAIADSDQAQHTGATPLEDDRPHVFECVTFANSAIERLFSVEDQPLEELHRVQQILERKKQVVRHALYSKHRAGTSHATTLEDLWHVVKVLRLPRDVRVLPSMRDEELVGSSGSYFNEQLFSTDDLAEVLLQLCNEQFLPQQVTPLSARVDFFVTHHLPFAMQNQSAMREIMHKLDVKRALSDHGQTMRTIFRRYCAKDKDLVAAAAAKRRAAAASSSSSFSPVPPSPPSGVTAASSTGAPSHSAVPQGITKFMRLSDWHAFMGDYKLLRARFTAEYATSVFRNVQEAESGLEDHLEMIYSEFCEAVVALSVWFFPDPFLRHATRVHQFIRRYLPVSPEDTRDHHV